MADDYLDIGAEAVFPLPMNWKRAPINTFTITRYLQSFPGTSQAISELNKETPISFEALFSIYNKADEKTLLEFIHTCRGRIVRFWIPYRKQMFDLYEAVSEGASAITCINNGALLSYHGYERIYILMNNGDILTRWITDITDDNIKLTLNLNSQIDRVIDLDGYVEIGRFLLVRFDSDKFDFEVDTTNAFEFSQRFFELVKEYVELAPNP